MKSLLEFHNDKETKENVKNFLFQVLEKETIKRVFDREDVSGLADAREVIEKAFEEMDVMFAPKIERVTENEAR